MDTVIQSFAAILGSLLLAGCLGTPNTLPDPNDAVDPTVEEQGDTGEMAWLPPEIDAILSSIVQTQTVAMPAPGAQLADRMNDPCEKPNRATTANRSWTLDVGERKLQLFT